MTDYFIYVGLLLLGGTLGAIAMALVSHNRSQDDDAEDCEMLDFLSRNELGLSVIKNPGAPAMWAVTTPSPVKMIGGLSHDPREAVSGTMVLMLEKEPANG